MKESIILAIIIGFVFGCVMYFTKTSLIFRIEQKENFIQFKIGTYED